MSLRVRGVGGVQFDMNPKGAPKLGGLNLPRLKARDSRAASAEADFCGAPGDCGAINNTAAGCPQIEPPLDINA